MLCRSLVHSAGIVLAAALTLATADLVAQGRPTTAGPLEVRGGITPDTRQGFTAAQLQNMHERIALAGEVVDRLEADAKRRGFADGWRRASLESLLSLNLAALRQVHQRSFSCRGAARRDRRGRRRPLAARQSEQGSDLHSHHAVPLHRHPQCRRPDRRDDTDYDIDNNGSLYGGAAACNPTAIFGVANADQVAAIAMNVTIVSPAVAPGFVAIKPTAASPVTSLVNWYEAGASVQVANQGIVTLLQDAAVPDEFVIQTSASVQVIVDVFGAFAPPQATDLNTWVNLTPRDLGANEIYEVYSPTCPAGMSVTSGGYLMYGFDQPAPSGNRPVKGISNAVLQGYDLADRWLCQGKSGSASFTQVLCFVVCARTRGR